MHDFFLSAPLRLCGLVVLFPLKFSMVYGSKKWEFIEAGNWPVFYWLCQLYF